jgi:hypothetical protein
MLLALASCLPNLAVAQLELLPGRGPQCVFGGAPRSISVVWRNAGEQTVAVPVSLRIYQESSATAMPLGDAQSWKILQVLPGQTELESVSVAFPGVKAETTFLIRWLANTNQFLGPTEVSVFPTNLLLELKPLARDEPIGVFDPSNEIKPLLADLKLEFVDLENDDLKMFSGKLAIFGPFQTKSQMRDGLAGHIQALARRNTAVVWLQPPPGPRDTLAPSFYLVPEGKGAVVVVRAEMVAGLSENPQSQINLLHCCRLALKPRPPRLPGLASQTQFYHSL